MRYTLTINGRKQQVDAPEDMPLLWVLRDELGMLGTKFGCGVGACGACTVHVDGQARRSCLLPVGKVGAAKITTIEQVGATPVGARLQQAWVQLDVPQCGYCQAGQIMSAAALLARTPKPTREQVTAGMAGNICRCATYTRILEAIQIAAGAQETAHVG